MPLDPYRAIRFLPIRTIAEQWYRDRIGHPQDRIEAELRRGLINLRRGRDWKVEGLVPLEEMPPLDKLPGPELEVTRDFVQRFAEKQRWPLPSFWFPDEPRPSRRGGRPSDMDLIREKLEERARQGKLCENVGQEAQVLNAWAVAQGLKLVKDDSVRKAISKRYSELLVRR